MFAPLKEEKPFFIATKQVSAPIFREMKRRGAFDGEQKEELCIGSSER